MDETQTTQLITAMADQTAALNRMADLMFGFLLHFAPEQARKLGAPNYQRRLEEYASFDWSSIGATVVALDKDGATEVEQNGNVYRRYRSSDDDPKGIDIRFRRVAAGTPEGGDMVWVTLIKFADPRDRKAPRPLKGDVAERVRASAPAAQPTAPPAPPAPPAPAKYSPTAAERKVVVDAVAFTNQLTEATLSQLQRQRAAITTQWEAICAAASLRKIDCGGRPASLPAAVKAIAALGATCAEYDKSTGGQTA